MLSHFRPLQNIPKNPPLLKITCLYNFLNEHKVQERLDFFKFRDELFCFGLKINKNMYAQISFFTCYRQDYSIFLVETFKPEHVKTGLRSDVHFHYALHS